MVVNRCSDARFSLTYHVTSYFRFVLDPRVARSILEDAFCKSIANQVRRSSEGSSNYRRESRAKPLISSDSWSRPLDLKEGALVNATTI